MLYLPMHLLLQDYPAKVLRQIYTPLVNGDTQHEICYKCNSPHCARNHHEGKFTRCFAFG